MKNHWLNKGMLNRCESLVDYFMNKPAFQKFGEQDRSRFISECMRIWQDRRSKGQDLRFPYGADSWMRTRAASESLNPPT